MKRYIRSFDTLYESYGFYEFNGDRYQLALDSDGYWIYDSDDTDRSFVQILNTFDKDTAINSLKSYNLSHTRIHNYIADLFNYCTANHDGGNYKLFHDYVEYTSVNGINALKSKIASFKKNHPGCNIRIRQSINKNTYYVYQI